MHRRHSTRKVAKSGNPGVLGPVAVVLGLVLLLVGGLIWFLDRVQWPWS